MTKGKNDIYELINWLNHDEYFEENKIVFGFKYHSYMKNSMEPVYVTILAIVVTVNGRKLKEPLHQWIYEDTQITQFLTSFENHCSVAYNELLRNIAFSIPYQDDKCRYLSFRDLATKPIEELLKFAENE